MAVIKQENSIITIDGANSSNKLDEIYQQTPIGQLSTVIGRSFKGINHRLMPSALPINKDHYGLTLFTRPQLNLGTDNIRNIRKLTPLLTTNPNSIQRIIRLSLDHQLKMYESLTCPFVDNLQAFIPIFTDTLVSLSGWPDVEAPTYTSPEGLYKESVSFIDGITEIYSTYNIQANFRNVAGDPITAYILNWIIYGSNVFRGNIMPYPKNLINNRIDYNTRIWRLVLDNDRNVVQKIGACGAAYPYAISIGSAYNFEIDQPINNSNDQITVPFKAIGAEYQDDILVYDFNRTVQLFNSGMKDENRNSVYMKIPRELLVLFNHEGYPRINPTTYELEWYVGKDTYNQLVGTTK